MTPLRLVEPGGIRRLLRHLAVVAGLLVLLGGISVVVVRADDCGTGVAERGPDNECVGVTDGIDGNPFRVRQLDGVIADIGKENAQVMKEGEAGAEYVTIAYFLPLTVRGSETDTHEANEHELLGAYLAQREANELATRPRVKMVLANPGRDADHWDVVVKQLRDLKDTEDRLMAVAGIGQTLQNTRDAVEELGRLGIPVIGSTVTGDGFSRTKGFARVTSTISDKVQALVAYAEQSATDRQDVMLVQDTKPGDPFGKSTGEFLIRDLRSAERLQLVGQVEEYDSSNPGYVNGFTNIAANVCVHRPELLYFSGRGRHLAHFLKALARRTCAQEHPSIVLAGDTTSVLNSDEEVRRLLGPRLRVIYTGFAHPKAWEVAPEAFSRQTVRRFGSGSPLDRDELVDGQAIMGHDAVLTAVRAIRLAAGEDGHVESSEEVMGQLKRLHTGQQVGGASGWISLCNNGNPADRPVPILELAQGVEGTGVEFLALSPTPGSTPDDPASGSVPACD